MKHFTHLFFVLLFPLCLSAQNSSFQSGEIWLDATVGLSFQNYDLARINQDIFLGQPEFDNQFAFQVIPKIEYAVLDKFLVGTHLGFSLNAIESNISKNLNMQNYKAGVHAKYYFLQIFDKLFLHAESGINVNHLTTDHYHNSYLKIYVDAGFSFSVSEYWVAGLTFKDVLAHYSNAPNFENCKNFSNNNFSDFINFPHFSLMYRFN